MKEKNCSAMEFLSLQLSCCYPTTDSVSHTAFPFSEFRGYIVIVTSCSHIGHISFQVRAVLGGRFLISSLLCILKSPGPGALSGCVGSGWLSWILPKLTLPKARTTVAPFKAFQRVYHNMQEAAPQCCNCLGPDTSG